MLCRNCQGISLPELIPLEFIQDEEIEQCQLINVDTAYQHQPCFQSLSFSAMKGCLLCVLIVTTLAEKQRYNNDDMIYRSSRGEEESALVDQLSTDYSAPIYLYRVDGGERQEDAGIFEIAVVPTFNYNPLIASASVTQPDAFFWRALEVWPGNGKSIALDSDLEISSDACLR